MVAKESVLTLKEALPAAVQLATCGMEKTA